MDVDMDLKLSCVNIKENLINYIRKFPNDDILDMEPFPNSHTLALLACAVYTDGVGELPVGWKYLTTASNKRWDNGYFGAAYWSPSLQQVVISHRGTQLKNTGALWTNCTGVIITKYSSHMNSAITFADIIMTVLCELNREEGVRLQLSVTGHSLGGWLAQVTAFTLQYVRRECGLFVKALPADLPHGRHVHTVTFDTPGCGDMLKKIIDDGYCRYRKTVSADHLDITNYLGPPNRINTCGSHVGTIRAVSLDLSSVGVWKRHTFLYTMATHKIDNFVKAFEGVVTTHEVLDWPVSSKEISDIFKTANCQNNYVPESVDEEQKQKTWKKDIRYKTEEIENVCNLRVFSEKEIYLLDLWSAIKAEQVRMTKISAFVKRHNLGAADLLAEFKIDFKNRTMTCQSATGLQAVVKRTKQLMRWFHLEFLEAVEQQSAGVSMAGPLLYQTVARSYLDSLPECQMYFKDIFGLKLESNETRILHIKTDDGQFQVSILYNLLSQMSECKNLNTLLRPDQQTFVNFRQIQDLDGVVNFEHLYTSEYSYDNLLVADGSTGLALECEHFFEQFLRIIKKKLIIISSPQSDYEHFLKSFGVPFKIVDAQVGLDSLTEESQKELFLRKMILDGTKLFALEDYTEIQNVSKLLSLLNICTDRHTLKRIVIYEKFAITMKDLLFNLDDLRVLSNLSKVSLVRVARALQKYSGNVLLVISGIDREELETEGWKELVGEGSEGRISITTIHEESTFMQLCQKNPDSAVYWLTASAGSVYCKTIYEKAFYMKRRWSNRFIFNIEQFASKINKDKKIQNAIFVFQNIESKQSLMRRSKISEQNKIIFMENDHIKTANSDEESDNIIRENNNRPVHILIQKGDQIIWQRSRGFLEGLRPYVTTDTDEFIDEKHLCETRQKVVITADEPGMGKSTTLTSMSRLMQQSAWVIRVNLKDFQIPIKDLPAQLSLNSVGKFLLRGEDSLLQGLLQFCLDKQNTHSRPVYILFDGFDEIKQVSSEANFSAEDKVLKLLKYLSEESTARIWITTRLYRSQKLEDALSVFAMRFEKISEEQQREFLVEFWRPHLLLEMDLYGDVEETKLRECAVNVYETTKRVLGTSIEDFMGIPLQMRMLAEIFMQGVKKYVNSEISIGHSFDVKSVLDLYTQFVNHKYEIYFREKTELYDTLHEYNKNIIISQYTEYHRLLGFRTLFSDFSTDNFDDPEDGWRAGLCRVGLVQSRGEDVEFLHRTLAEYFCADLLVHWLRKKGRYLRHAPMAELLLTKVFLESSNKVVRIFINNLVLSQPLPADANKLIATKIGELWRDKQHVLFNRNQFMQTALYIAVRENNIGLVNFLLGCLKCEPVQVISYIAARDKTGCTALLLATHETNNVIIINILQSLKMCPNDVILEFLLATYIGNNKYEYLYDYLQGDEYSEIKRAFIRTRQIIQDLIPPFLEAVEGGRVEVVKQLYNNMNNVTERCCMLLARNSGGETALHLAAEGTDDNTRNQIITILCKHRMPEVGRLYNTAGDTPLHSAAAAGHLDTVEHLINHGVYMDCPSTNGETALFSAARSGSLPVVELLLQRGSDINIINIKGETALFYAAISGSHGIMEVMELLLQTGSDMNIVNNEGETSLFYAARSGSLPVVEFLVQHKFDINIINNYGETALFGAARYGKLPIVEFLIKNRSDINIINTRGETALFYAVRSGSLPMVELFKNYGVDVNIVNSRGKTALSAD